MQRKFHGGAVDPSISEQISKAIVDQWSFRDLAAAVVEQIGSYDCTKKTRVPLSDIA